MLFAVFSQENLYACLRRIVKSKVQFFYLQGFQIPCMSQKLNIKVSTERPKKPCDAWRNSEQIFELMPKVMDAC